MNGIKTFVTKFGNDWSINLAGMLTYSLITAIVPILVAILSIAGIVLNLLSPASFHSVVTAISNAMPSNARSVIDVNTLLKNLVQITGPLAVVSLVGLVWTGSNLFTNVENAFSIVFRTKDRDFIPQRLMALGMVVILAILLPLALLASSLVTAGSQAFQSFLPQSFGVVLSIVGPVTSVGILWVLFLAIYMVVPNVQVPFRDAWRGALVAAVLLAVIDLIFPLYVKIFLSGNQKYGAAVLTLLVLLIFLWFFNVILMVGAQVNAVAMGYKATTYDLARTLATDYWAARAAPGAARRGRIPLAPVRNAAKVGGAVRSVLVGLGRLVAPPLRVLALLGWLAARPFVGREQREAGPRPAVRPWTRRRARPTNP